MTRVILHSIHWLYATPGPKYLVITCARCTREDRIALPIPVGALEYFTRAYQEVHRHC